MKTDFEDNNGEFGVQLPPLLQHESNHAKQRTPALATAVTQQQGDRRRTPETTALATLESDYFLLFPLLQ
jgi:hypothetical protein